MILTLPVSHLISTDNFSKVPGIGAIEYRNLGDVLLTEKTKLFHSGKGIIEKDFLDYFDSVRPFLVENDVQLFSCDLGPAAGKVKIVDHYYVAKTAILTREKIMDYASERLAHIRLLFKGDIALENLGYYDSSAYSHVCGSEFISRIVRNNDIYFVLDIAHGIVSAGNMMVDRKDYFLSLPLERTKEIHLSSPVKMGRYWWDMHSPPSLEVLEIVDLVKERIPQDVYVVVEYYEDFNQLVEIYKNLESKEWFT